MKSILFIFSIFLGIHTLAQEQNTDPWNSRHNLIKNWNFTSDLTDWGGWIDNMVEGQMAPVVENGVVLMTTGLALDGNSWHYQLNQSELKAEANVPYTLKFKSWSNIPRSNSLDFEDSPENNYNRYGASTDPESPLGRSEWVYYTTSNPRWFTFHVVFDQMVPTTQQKIQWNLSTADATTYLDSIILIKADTSSANSVNLTLSATQLNFQETESNLAINISSNTDWQVRSNQTWLSIDPGNGFGNQTLTLKATANPWFATRSALVTVYAIGLEPQTIKITQDEKPELPVQPGDSTIVENWNDESWNSYNLIKNWDFTTDLTDWGGWIDNIVEGQMAPVVENGVVSMTTGLALDGNDWHYQLNQSGIKAEANVPYILKFKSWSSTIRSNGLDFEDSPQNNYNRYGASTDLESTLGRSEWIYYTTKEPKWYTFHVVFDQMLENTEQKIQWMLSTATATTYLDSIILIKDADLLSIENASVLLSATQVNLSAAESNTTVSLTSNTKCMAIKDQDWLTITPENCSGSQTITISAKANPFPVYRTATITVFPSGVESQTITVSQEAFTGLIPILNIQKFTFYPNPTSGKIKLISEHLAQAGAYLTISDLTGRNILKHSIHDKEEWIDLTGNNPGIYFIKTNLKNVPVQRVILK